MAGDATGIILAAVITAALGLPMWLDRIVEYLAGFACGLLIFHSLFMKSMMGGSYLENVRKSFTPEFISMNFMMAGMAPVMSLLMMGRDMRAMQPTELLFWGVMSLGVMAGFITAYPANVWMVLKSLKHGLMTDRKGAAAGTKGHQHDRAHEAKPAPKTSKSESNHSAHGMAMASDVTVAQLAAVGGISLLALITGLVTPGNWVNLRLSAREVGGSIMPPGMHMDRDTPAEAMRDMAAVNPREVSARYDVSVRGDQPLEPEFDGV